MSEQEIKGLIPSSSGQPQDQSTDGNLMLTSQIVCEKEIKDIEEKVQKHVDDVEQLAKQNVEAK